MHAFGLLAVSASLADWALDTGLWVGVLVNVDPILAGFGS